MKKFGIVLLLGGLITESSYVTKFIFLRNSNTDQGSWYDLVSYRNCICVCFYRSSGGNNTEIVQKSRENYTIHVRVELPYYQKWTLLHVLSKWKSFMDQWGGGEPATGVFFFFFFENMPVPGVGHITYILPYASAFVKL